MKVGIRLELMGYCISHIRQTYNACGLKQNKQGPDGQVLQPTHVIISF